MHANAESAVALWTGHAFGREGAVYSPSLSPIQYAGVLRVRPHQDAQAWQTGGYVSTRSWDLTDGQAQVEVVSIATGAASAAFTLGADADNWLRLRAEGTTLHFEANVAGARSETTTSYDALQHRYWRLAHDSGTQLVRWETSPDQATWTVGRTLPTGFAVTALRAELMAGSANPSLASGEAKFDNFKLHQGKFAP
jgi:hypothetical protein